MKKFIVIGRPYSNGGDYLIFERLLNILKAAYPKADITFDLSNDNQFDIEELNQYDAIITGGGGAQFSEQYVRTSFIYQHFDEIKVPIHYAGTGLYGADGADKTVYGYRYSDDMISYFERVIERGGQIATRDWTVDTVFRNNGIHGTVMAGCPAWYDLEMLGQEKDSAPNMRRIPMNSVKCIAVSNHGLTKNNEDHGKKLEQIESLIMFLQEKFNSPEVLLTFNDGYITKYSKNYNLSLQKWAKEHGVTCIDLSNDAGKFKALDQIDFHIGFRVHTHIYCLSKKIPSLLIEEDIRGFGMNETLHLPHITAYGEDSTIEDFHANPYLNAQLAVLLAQMDEQERIDYDAVFRIIEDSYHTGMQKWLANLLR